MAINTPSREPLKSLSLQGASFAGFDGGAGWRYQAKREIKSFWQPTRSAQPAALVLYSRVLAAAADELSIEPSLRRAAGHQLVIKLPGARCCPASAKFAELRKFWQILKARLTSAEMMRRRLCEDIDFFRFLRVRQA